MPGINHILNKPFEVLTEGEKQSVSRELASRMRLEFQNNVRSGIYARTQVLMAYNSNRIEGSTLTKEHTESLFDTGAIMADGEIIRAKDVEEMTGHFAMFNAVMKTYPEPLAENMVKNYHYTLKAGVFEDMANGYPVGEYKKWANTVRNIKTARPEEVHQRLYALLAEHNAKTQVSVKDLADLHAKYELIHPFQDGNGRTGRAIILKECLKNSLIPVIIRDDDKAAYYEYLYEAQTTGNSEKLAGFFVLEQKKYFSLIREYLFDHSLGVPEMPEKLRKEYLSLCTLANMPVGKMVYETLGAKQEFTAWKEQDKRKKAIEQKYFREENGYGHAARSTDRGMDSSR